MVGFTPCSAHSMVRPRLTIYVCQESQQLRDLQQKHEDGDTVTSTFFGKGFRACLRARVLGAAAAGPGRIIQQTKHPGAVSSPAPAAHGCSAPVASDLLIPTPLPVGFGLPKGPSLCC